MDDRALKYVKDLLKQGYTPEIIRQQLKQANYSPSEIETLFSQATGFSSSTLPVVIISIVVLALVVGAIVWYVVSLPPSFNVSVSPDKQTYTAGDSLTFTVSTSPSGYDVLLSYVLINSATKNQVLSSSETAKTGSKSSILSLPADLSTGNYELRVAMTYSSITKTAKSNIFVNAVTTEQKTAISNVKPAAVSSECGSCDDFNSCTTDTCVKGSCENTAITPCCGDNVCDSAENTVSCASDCRPIALSTSSGDVEAAKSKARTDAMGAAQICASIPSTSEGDRCYTEISQIAKDSNLCNPIQDITARDSCYIEFAFNDDSSVCPKIVDNYLQLSCYNLFNLKQ